MRAGPIFVALVVSMMFGVGAAGPAQATPEPAPKADPPRQVAAPDVARGVIIRTSARGDLADVRSAVSRLSMGIRIESTRSLTPTTDLLLFSEMVPADRARAVAAALNARQDVEWAEADVRVRRSATPLIPNDTYFSAMKPLWNGGGSSDFSIKAPLIWRAQDGAPSVVVAIIDSGITRHPDLDANMVAGYDFVSDARVANDGDGWDSDPSDPGDWITSAEDSSGYFEGCGDSNSSWHGTHVAGTVGAIQGNAIGVTGVAPGSRMQAVRVLGKCGGFISDIAAGITWASGGAVSGVPMNPTPAKVLNLSLGGNGTCTPESAYGQAIGGAIARGSTVIVAAGNEDEPITNKRPANCSGAVAVTAVDVDGRRSGYSNYGVVQGQATIAAPGGDFEFDDGVLSTLNDGTRGPGNPSYEFYQGTSMATPHVAGAAALLYSAGVTSPSKVREALMAAVQPFPAYGDRWDCSVVTCGSGILDVSRLNLVPPESVPDAPTAVTATPASEQSLVNWTAPSWNGGRAITGYTATASPGGQVCSTTGALSCTVTGLTNGTAYTFTVTATNALGRSVPSEPSLAVTPITVPGAPTGVTAVPGIQRMAVSWSAPLTNGGAPITGYIVTGSPGGQGCSTSGALTCEVAGLSAAGAYTFTVTATNTAGSSVSSVASVAAAPRTPTPAGALAWGVDSTCGQSTIPADASQDVSAVAGGWNFSLALASGRVLAWGCDDADQLMVPVEAQAEVTDIAAGFFHGLALRQGRVIAWGGWGEENIGQATVPSIATNGVSAVSAGGWTSMALKEGRVIAWGNNGNGQASVPADALSGVSTIASGGFHSLALKDGGVIAWGSDYAGQTVVPVEARSGVTAIAAGTYHSLALKAGRVIAWGADDPDGDFDYGQTLVPTEAKSGVIAIAAGEEHSLALKTDGRVIAWGGGGFGATLVPSAAQASVISIAAGGLHSLALRSAPPTAPTRVVGLAGNAEVAVSWGSPGDIGGSSVTGYVATASPGGRSCSTTGALSCTVTGLTNGTAYTFTVTATNAAGTSLASFASAAVTPRVPVVAPGAVGALKATAAKGALRVTWARPVAMGGAASVTYQYQVGGAAWKSTSATSVSVPGRKGARLTVQVRAVNEAGAGPAVSVSGIPK